MKLFSKYEFLLCKGASGKDIMKIIIQYYLLMRQIGAGKFACKKFYIYSFKKKIIKRYVIFQYNIH